MGTMSTFTTAADLNTLQADISAAKSDLGKMAIERESARTLLLVERLTRIVESLDERTRESERTLKRLTGDGK